MGLHVRLDTLTLTSGPEDYSKCRNVHTALVKLVTEIPDLDAHYSRTATDDLTRDFTVLSRNLAVKITSDFHAKRRPQNQSNLLQIRRYL